MLLEWPAPLSRPGVKMDFVAAVRRDAAAIFELCSQDPVRSIASCPDWTAADLSNHIVETFAGALDDFGDPAGLECSNSE